MNNIIYIDDIYRILNRTIKRYRDYYDFERINEGELNIAEEIVESLFDEVDYERDCEPRK